MIIATHLSMVLTEAGFAVMGIMPSGEAALAQIQAAAPDLILMDIELKGQIDGVETARVIHEQSGIPVIFLTANSDQKSFERAKSTHPLGFIAKPFQPTQLIRTIELAAMRSQLKEQESEPDSPLQEGIPLQFNDRIFVRHKNRMVKLFLDHIRFIEAERNYCKIVTQERDYTLSIPMKRFAEQIQAPKFQRVHRSFIINLEHVDSLDESYVYVLQKAIPVSKSYKEALHQRIKLI